MDNDDKITPEPIKIEDLRGTPLPNGFNMDNDKAINKALEKALIQGDTERLKQLKKECQNIHPVIKFHFEISLEMWERAKKYIGSERGRHTYAKIAFEEMINRREGRDKKLQTEKLKKDAGYIQEMIDAGLIKFTVENGG